MPGIVRVRNRRDTMRLLFFWFMLAKQGTPRKDGFGKTVRNEERETKCL